MGDFTLPSLPPDFVPNFLTQPHPINNDTSFPDIQDCIPLLEQYDPSCGDRFHRNADGFLSELDDTLNNLAQNDDKEYTLSREQWIETAALHSQAMVNGLITKSRGVGAISLKNDLPLESRAHLVELAKNLEMMNRYFQLPYDKHTTNNY